MTHVPPHALLSLALLCAVSGCKQPEPPKKQQPPDPQAQQHTQLRDAIQAPIDRARTAEPTVLDAARKQRDDIDAQTGG